MRVHFHNIVGRVNCALVLSGELGRKSVISSGDARRVNCPRCVEDLRGGGGFASVGTERADEPQPIVEGWARA